MHLISPFASLIKGGVILNLKISAGGGENIQLDILPQGKDSATGVALPPKALVGTAQELDTHLEEYLHKYAASLERMADVVANADAELKTLEDAALAQARNAIQDKSKSKATTARPGTKPVAGGARKDMSAGLVDESEGEHDADRDEDGTPAALIETGGAGEGATAGPTHTPGPGAGKGMSQALFV
jgi:PRTRC genetic system protein E